MSKRITVTLTEDQASKIIGALEGFYYENPSLDKYEKDHNAFIRRLVDKLKLARAKS